MTKRDFQMQAVIATLAQLVVGYKDDGEYVIEILTKAWVMAGKAFDRIPPP